MRVLTAARMRDAEQAAVRAGTSFEALMENAGTAAAAAIEQLAGGEKTALLLCGRGNNAGDALVVARLLARRGWRCECRLLCGQGLSPLARLNLGRLPETVKVTEPGATDLYTAAVLVDAVFGIGFHGALPGGVRAALAAANAAPGLRVALDVPSGLDCDSGEADGGTFRAGVTLTFGAYKPGLLVPRAAEYVGRVQCLDIGL